MSESCPCWSNTYALGHEGHCCFTPGANGERFKADDDVCHGEEYRQ
ncbi:hypothetical protein GCM10027076_03480 [Nocardioides montaniterrae]